MKINDFFKNIAKEKIDTYLSSLTKALETNSFQLFGFSAIHNNIKSLTAKLFNVLENLDEKQFIEKTGKKGVKCLKIFELYEAGIRVIDTLEAFIDTWDLDAIQDYRHRLREYINILKNKKTA